MTGVSAAVAALAQERSRCEQRRPRPLLDEYEQRSRRVVVRAAAAASLWRTYRRRRPSRTDSGGRRSRATARTPSGRSFHRRASAPTSPTASRLVCRGPDCRDEKAHGPRDGVFQTAHDRKVEEKADTRQTTRAWQKPLQTGAAQEQLHTTEIVVPRFESGSRHPRKARRMLIWRLTAQGRLAALAAGACVAICRKWRSSSDVWVKAIHRRSDGRAVHGVREDARGRRDRP